MTNEEAINEIEMIISCIKQYGIDWLDDRDIPTLETAIEALENNDKLAEDLQNCLEMYKKKKAEVESLKNQWIPCEERLPDYHDEVLVTSRGEVAIAWLYLDGNWRSNDMPEPMYKDILAWMPLPKAYEGRTEE